MWATMCVGKSTEISDVGQIQEIPRERQVKAMTSADGEFCRSAFAMNDVGRGWVDTG